LIAPSARRRYLALATKTNGAATASDALTTVPVGYVPTPTEAYRSYNVNRSLTESAVAGATSTIPKPAEAKIPPKIPRPLPFQQGARVLIWKQDPTIGEIGVRKAFLPSRVFAGPRDARIKIEGLPTVAPNIFGDIVVQPVDADAFDAVHTFAVVRQTLTLFERTRGGIPLPWQWNGSGNTEPIAVHPHAGITPNAFYSRTQKVLKFFAFTPQAQPGGPAPDQVFTCRSLDIVAHECGHAILDGLKPGWLTSGNTPQTGGLHESFGDIAAMFLALSQMDQVEAIIAQTKGDLHQKNFLADLAEQFGMALGRPNGLRNADNDLKLSQVSTEVHAISQVFTGGMYDAFADIYAFEQRPHLKDDAAVLYEVGQYMTGLVLRAIIASPASNAKFADVVNQMMVISATDGKPQEYRDFIKNRFVDREVLATNVAGEQEGAQMFEAAITDEPGAIQDRSGCCGTMLRSEYDEDATMYKGYVEDLQRSFDAEGDIFEARDSEGFVDLTDERSRS
jgi:hypothetical protein